jgi:outer membrane biosynthesis protein TonB
MLPQTQARKKRNSSKVNLLISFIFHTVLVLALFYFAARSGMLGHQLKKITVELEKKQPQKPKEPEKPKEQPKIEQPKVAETPKPAEAPKAAAPAPSATPNVAPPPVELPSLVFEGGNAAVSSTDPVDLYKGSLQNAYLSKWSRPENLPDDNYVADVQVEIGRDGRILGSQWQKGSGDSRWDDSVRAAVAAVTKMNRPPPTNFPPSVTIRFDVQKEADPLLP